MMKKERIIKSQFIKKGIVSVLLISILLLSGGFATRNFEIAKNLDILATLYRELHVNYIKEINPAELIQTGINEMLKTLDPYTNFIPESEIEEYRFMTTGQYGGIGALVQTRDSNILITEPYEGFPAHKSGLRAGDIILKVDNFSTENRDSEEIAELLKGQPGTMVELLIKRLGEPEPFTVSVEREVIKIDNIPYFGVLNDNVGYIKLTGFTENAGREVREALNKLRDEYNLEYLILDLRNNGGGLLNEAVNVTNLFIDRNKTVVSIEGRNSQQNTKHRTLNNPVDLDIPLAVLVNRQSASASEIVAGAIQDYDRGIIIGERTFGKGLVQNIVPLSYNTQLKVTVAEYLIPSGRSIQAVDYASRHDDGSVSRIPDSLKTAYETNNGRIVYDGGGIEPDIILDMPTLSDVSRALIQNHIIFDFVTKFHLENPQIADPEKFVITKKIYDDFLNYISDKDYDYETASQQKVRELRQALQQDKYYTFMEEKIADIEKTVASKKNRDIELFGEEIQYLLLMEIIPRYYYQRGRAKASLHQEDLIEKAIEALKDEQAYSQILSIKNKPEKQDLY